MPQLLAVGGTLTQLDEEGHDRAVAYFSKRLNNAEENYSANDRELLGLLYFLRRFRCYLEGSEFEVITDNQVLHYFSAKPNLSRQEARWLEFLAQFGITELTLEKGRIHVLGDALSRAPHAPLSENLEITNIQTFDLELPANYIREILKDQLFGPVWKVLKGNSIKNKLWQDRVIRIIPTFKIANDRLMYEGKTCIP